MGHTQKKRFIDKEIYRKSYGSDVPSEIYPPPSPIPKPLEFTYPSPPLPSPSLLARDVIYGWPLSQKKAFLLLTP